LEIEGKDIGLVTHGSGKKTFLTQIPIHRGKEKANTGLNPPCPCARMAGLGMAKVLQLVDEIAWSHQPDAFGAAGLLMCIPTGPQCSSPARWFFTSRFAVSANWL